MEKLKWIVYEEHEDGTRGKVRAYLDSGEDCELFADALWAKEGVKVCWTGNPDVIEEERRKLLDDPKVISGDGYIII